MVRDAVEAAGARPHFLPLYSTNFNPIVMSLSQFKAHLREAAERAVERSRGTIGQILDAIMPDECSAFSAAEKHDPKQIEGTLVALAVNFRIHITTQHQIAQYFRYIINIT